MRGARCARSDTGSSSSRGRPIHTGDQSNHTLPRAPLKPQPAPPYCNHRRPPDVGDLPVVRLAARREDHLGRQVGGGAHARPGGGLELLVLRGGAGVAGRG